MNTQGTHSEGNITFTTSHNIAERYLFGTLENGKLRAAGSGKEAQALGVITDAAAAGDAINIQVLGSNAGTMKALAGSKILAGEFITADANSRACSLETQEAGNYNVYGIALSNAEAGQCVEFTPTLGLQKAVN